MKFNILTFYSFVMQKLLEQIEKIRKSHVRKAIDTRMHEFSELGKKSQEKIFSELCFCILTANFRADRAIEVQRKIGKGFLTLSKAALAQKLKKLGCRFHTTKAGYISEARKHVFPLSEKCSSSRNGQEIREWLVKNIKGLGYKEASHFLRNIGYTDVAIIDFHIIDLLARHGLVRKSKTKSLTRKKYLAIEQVLEKIAGKARLNLAELDLYLWYLETGKVLK